MQEKVYLKQSEILDLNGPKFSTGLYDNFLNLKLTTIRRPV